MNGKLHFDNWRRLNWQKTGKKKSFRSSRGLLRCFFVLEQRFLISYKTHDKLKTHCRCHLLGCKNGQEVNISKAASPILLYSPSWQQLIFNKGIAFHNNSTLKQTSHACLCLGFTRPMPVCHHHLTLGDPSHDSLSTLNQFWVIVLTCMWFHFHEGYNISFIPQNCLMSTTTDLDVEQAFKKDIHSMIQELQGA